MRHIKMLHIVNDKCIFCIYIFRILGRLYIHIYLSLKFKISAIWLVAVAYMNLMFLIATMQKYQWNVTGRLTGNTKHFNLNYPKTSMWKYRVEQHLFVLNLHSTWIKKYTLKSYNSESFTKPKFVTKYVTTLKWTQYIKEETVSIKPLNTKQINRVQNIRIKKSL